LTLDQNHNRIYADPNELIEAGFPASFLLPLIKAFASSEGHKYFWDGTIVSEMIGISCRIDSRDRPSCRRTG
jgi:hypothetical protein